MVTAEIWKCMKDFISFKWKDALANLLCTFTGNTSVPDDVLFVTLERTKKWILGAKARRLSRNCNGESRIFYSTVFKSMTDRDFIPVGRDWENCHRFNEIKALPNFAYSNNVPYENYPDIYSMIDVLVSPSNIEGGPVPLLEAMLCTVIPIATRNGFGPDLIKNGENGFLFDSKATVNNGISLTGKAYKLKTNVRKAAAPHSWKNYGEKISKLFLVDK